MEFDLIESHDFETVYGPGSDREPLIGVKNYFRETANPTFSGTAGIGVAVTLFLLKITVLHCNLTHQR